jgi:hypothetical protein
MSEIQVDVILPESSSVDLTSPTQDLSAHLIIPNANSVDVISPTQALAANVIVPGPEGPRGEKGDKGEKGDSLTGVLGINNLSGNILITGADGVEILNTGNNILVISGNSGYFEKENTIGFSYSLPIGNDTFFIQYPYILFSNPRSISCIFQNELNNMIYYPSISNVNTTGFYVNLSDIVSENGYYLNINVKK